MHYSLEWYRLIEFTCLPVQACLGQLAILVHAPRVGQANASRIDSMPLTVAALKPLSIWSFINKLVHSCIDRPNIFSIGKGVGVSKGIRSYHRVGLLCLPDKMAKTIPLLNDKHRLLTFPYLSQNILHFWPKTGQAPSLFSRCLAYNDENRRSSYLAGGISQT